MYMSQMMPPAMVSVAKWGATLQKAKAPGDKHATSSTKLRPPIEIGRDDTKFEKCQKRVYICDIHCQLLSKWHGSIQPAMGC